MLVLVLLMSGCTRPPLPEAGTNAYEEAVTAFYTSVASVQSGEDAGAESNLLKVTDLAPGEPAAWYNLGLLALRQNDFELGRTRLMQAASLAPENGDIQRLIGIMELTEGNTEAGIEALRRATQHNEGDARAWFALAQELGRSTEEERIGVALGIYERLAGQFPENQAVLVEWARLAARQQNLDALRTAVDALEELSGGWSEDVRNPFDTLEEATAGGDTERATVQAGFLRNMLLSTFNYRRDLAAVQTPTEEVGVLLDSFIRLPAPVPEAAPADARLRFVESILVETSENPVLVEATLMDGEGAPDTLLVYPQAVSINGARFDHGSASRSAAIALLDYNYDFHVDVVHVNDEGVLFVEQDTLGAFRPRATVDLVEEPWASRPYTRVWSADLDLEGDLDLLLAPAEGSLVVLRNTGDGRFDPVDLFTDVPTLMDFAWADFDGDGDPDPALLTLAGELYLYANERMGQFERRDAPPGIGNGEALAVGDTDNNGRIDLVVVNRDGRVVRLFDDPGNGWTADVLFDAPGVSAENAGPARLFIQDVDNNGIADVVVGVSGSSSLWLGEPGGGYLPVPEPVDGRVLAVRDMDGDGLLDLLGLNEAGTAMLWTTESEAGYHWQVLRPRAGQALGDQRINSFALGGEIEIRAGMLYQKQPIQHPVVHFGLGTQRRTDVARIIWPNGDIQSEFELGADASIFMPQRLKGSCPWLFTYNGAGMQFVTDFLWRSPLGLSINAQETAGIATTTDWVKIRGDQLVVRDGIYDVRITAELWETHFFDHVSLLAIDYPEETSVFVDERFVFPPPSMELHPTSHVQPVRRVTTDLGQDVTEVVMHNDGRYLDFFGRGRYQGITREHAIEIELGDVLGSGNDVVLVASGWVRPTDSSINVAISQGDQDPPRGLILEMPDGTGGWEVVRDDLGFPAGKTKTVLIDLEDVPATRDRVRLRTNLEIYWDRIGWAERAPEAERNERAAPLVAAELRYRGFSEVAAANRSSPELPAYERLAGTMPRWRDLIGYHTRYGDVSALLDSVDDRYVIMNAGDEMRLQFKALPPPPAGWQRDFVLKGDGWVKDGDYNTAFSKTVIPLPSHDNVHYTTPPTTLWEDPVYRKHAEDWDVYHTRYVAPDRFVQALVP